MRAARAPHSPNPTTLVRQSRCVDCSLTLQPQMQRDALAHPIIATSRMEDVKEKGHEGAAAAFFPQRRAQTRRRQASLASLRRRSPSRPEMLDQAVPVELASAPHADAGAVYDQEQMSNVSDADIHVVVTPNEVQ